MKNNVLAAAFSAVLPGVGQFYTHHWVKGAGFLAAVMIISGFMRGRMHVEGSISAIGWVLLLALFGTIIISVVDAYRSE